MTSSSRRRAHLMRLLALLSSMSVGAVVIGADLADANTPRRSEPQVEQDQKVEKKKPVKKPKSRLNFGRFEGY